MHVEELSPRTVGYLGHQHSQSKPKAGYWPVRVDTYFDPYVAGVWNTCRVARLILTEITHKLFGTLNGLQQQIHEQTETLNLIGDILASVPYHLAEDIHGFVSGSNDKAEELAPGRAVGGLLLMYPIFVAAHLSVVPPQVQTYFKDCLEWIGYNMGIGQASVLAKVMIQRPLILDCLAERVCLMMLIQNSI